MSDNIEKINRSLVAAHRRGLAAVSVAMHAKAVRLVPYITGKLKLSIKPHSDESGAYCDANAEYAAEVEYRKPYMRPALQEKKLKDLYVSEISKALR